MISKVPSCHFQEKTYTIEANYKAISCFVLALTFIRPLADLRIIWVGPPGGLPIPSLQTSLYELPVSRMLLSPEASA